MFAPIPAYLHASPNDYLYWKKDVSTLLEETTGLSIRPDDGLPRKMCALCISYLKHAATFRQQVIDNTLSLRAAQAVLESRTRDRQGNGLIQIEYEPETKGQANLNGIDIEKLRVEYTEEDLIFNEKRKTETNNLVNNVFSSTPKSLLTSTKIIPNNQNCGRSDNVANTSNLTAYLNLLFDRKAERPRRNTVKNKRNDVEDTMFDQTDSLGGDEFQTASSDDTEGAENRDYFSYKEKSFVEDDIMSLDFIKDANIVINIPEHMKERKCPACFRRFMFEDSYKDHMNSCLEYKFLSLIENLNRLAGFRRNKAISPHEFIRRTIFSLRATCQYLTNSCGEEISMPDLLTNGEPKNVGGQSESTGKDQTGSETDDKQQKNGEGKHKRCHSLESDPLMNLLREKADSSTIRYVSDSSGRLSRNTGSTSLCQSPHAHQTSKTSISTSSDHSSGTTNTEQNITIRSNPNGRKSLLDSFNQVADERTSTPNLPPPLSPLNMPFGSVKMNFTARCNACDTIFESIASLEEHNLKYHNNFQKLEDHKRIIAMFESDDDAIGGGTVDILSAAKIDFNTKKTIKCNTCDRSFSTITHLDQHKIKCSPKKKRPSPPYQRFT